MVELSLLVLKFNDTYGAARALDGLRARGLAYAWVDEVGIIERHDSGRVSTRGTYAGYYFEAEEGDAEVASGALGGFTGSLIGLIGGPAGFLVGGALGTAAGAGVAHGATRKDEGAAYDEIKQVLEKGTSALVLVAARPTLDEFAAAFADAATAVDRAITEEEARTLAESAGATT